MPRIFIQIASYRDPQLVPTVLDCLAQAADPGSLHFCIAWQHGPEETIDALRDHLQVTLIDIPHHESKGACWARNQIQQRYGGEEFTLALDSHHRFVPGWDRKCLEMITYLQRKGHPKPLLTTYAPPFDPDNDPAARHQYATKMDFDRFIPEGAIFFRPSSLPEGTPEPVPARFFSAHFVFTVGAFCVEVPHDPELYFHGEEISLAVRAYTHGYDLFHPHKILCWHEYTRKGRPKHWDDHAKWTDQNEASHARCRDLFGMNPASSENGSAADFGKFGLGTARTLRQYERYAGVHFKKRLAHPDTIAHRPLSSRDAGLSDAEWERSLSVPCEHIIPFTFHPRYDDYSFWCVAYKDEHDLEIFRRDVVGDELAGYLGKLKEQPGAPVLIPSQFHVGHDRPARRWVVWPHSKTEGWCEKAEGAIA